MGSAHKTCCCHVKTGAIIIAVLVLLSAINGIVLSVYGITELKWSSLSTASSIAANSICILCVALLFYGVSKEKPGYLIPHMVMQVVFIIGEVLLFLCLMVALSPWGQHQVNLYVSRRSNEIQGVQNQEQRVAGVSLYPGSRKTDQWFESHVIPEIDRIGENVGKVFSLAKNTPQAENTSPPKTADQSSPDQDTDQYMSKLSPHMVMVIVTAALVSIICMLLNVFGFIIVKRCYDYLYSNPTGRKYALLMENA